MSIKYQYKNVYTFSKVVLGISTNFDSTTAQYVDVRIERMRDVLDTYHKAVVKSEKYKLALTLLQLNTVISSLFTLIS